MVTIGVQPGRRGWTRAVAAVAAAAVVGGLVLYHRTAQPGANVSRGWAGYFQAYLSLLALIATATVVACDARWRARALAAATGGGLSLGLLSALSIGPAVLLVTALVGLATRRDARVAGRDPLRLGAGAALFLLAWIGLTVCPP